MIEFAKELAALSALTRSLLDWEERSGVGGLVFDPSKSAPKPQEQRVSIQKETSLAEPLSVLQREAEQCTDCELHRGRTHSVFSRGTADADLLFLGEGPGFHEDQQGVPFVGPAGQLLDKMIAAMGLDGDSVYICNVVKCRPPNNRTPVAAEANACSRFLVPQIDQVHPKVIVALGKCAAENLGCVPRDNRRWRGTWRTFRGYPVMPTYHPAFLLRSPEFKRVVWQDLQQVMAKLLSP
ncbi:MAG: uracil-DNA glycosylase [Myxococcota bacterium]